MTEKETNPQSEPSDLVASTEMMFRDAARELYDAIRRIQDGKLGEVKSATHAIRELRAAFQSAMEERKRVERQRKEDAGIVNQYALDFDAARVEIGRRLALLRGSAGG